MPNNIYRRGNTWWGRLEVGGIEYRKSLRTTDESAARLAVEDWRKSFERGPKGSDPLWEEAVVAWAETIDAMDGDDGLKPNVKKRYIESLRMFDNLWRGKRLSEIGRREVFEFIAQRKKGFLRKEPDGRLKKIAKVTNATVRRDLTAASSVFRVAVASGFCEHNPPHEWDRSVIKERKRVMVPPLPHEIETVLSYASGNFGRLVAFAANTGMRQNEVAIMEWRDYRAERGEVLLPSTKVSRPRAIRLTTPGGDAAGTLAGTPRHITAQ